MYLEHYLPYTYVMYNVNICRANIFIKYAAANIKWVRPRTNKPLPLLK